MIQPQPGDIVDLGYERLLVLIVEERQAVVYPDKCRCGHCEPILTEKIVLLVPESKLLGTLKEVFSIREIDFPLETGQLIRNGNAIWSADNGNV